MPSNNPFYNGTMLADPHVFDEGKGQQTGVILRKNLDFSLMTKKQQVKIKTLLQARANYLQVAAKKLELETERMEQPENADLSFTQIIRKRDRENRLKSEVKNRKDHFFPNQYVI